MSAIKITLPLTDESIAKLKAGDRLLITGTIYTARDAAHKKMAELIQQGRQLPIDVKGQIIYYVGPTPPKPGQIIGSAGPTTASRMDSTTPPLLKLGLKGTIGKGERGQALVQDMIRYKAIYMAAIGGAGALLAKCIKKADVVAYPELGTEAIRKLEVENFPVVVINDIYGGNYYKEGREKYAVK